MTPNPLAPRYGRAGGVSPQQVREFGDITVSSISYTANTSGIILADCSTVTGNADSCYLIWGYVCAHSASSGAFGYIEDTEPGDVDDYRENIKRLDFIFDVYQVRKDLGANTTNKSTMDEDTK